MKKRGIVIELFCIMLLASSFSLCVAEMKSGSTNPTAKVQVFLRAVDKANSLGELAGPFKAAKFSPAELRELEEAMKKPPYNEKMKSLQDKSLSVGKRKAEARTTQIKAHLERQSSQKRNQELHRLNGQASARLRMIKGSALATPPKPSKRGIEMTSEMVRAQTSRPGGTVPGKINSVRPSPVTVGQALAITGEDFGATQGRVALVLGREMFYCTISNWSQRQITASIPDDLQDALRERERTVLLWVKLYGGETGPARDLIVRPDHARMTPEVTSVTPGEVSPGQTVVIEGKSFLGEPRGSVEFKFAGNTYAGTINEWTDTYISVNLPGDLRGLAQAPGAVEVRNHVDLKARKLITFIPTKEIKTEVAYHMTWALIFGQKEQATDWDFALINGWKVTDNHFEKIEEYLAGGGCRYISQAQAGSTNARSRIELWADFFGTIYCNNYLTIEGPLGLPYR